MEVLEPLNINKFDNTEKNKKEITNIINKLIEKMILRDPKQWIWTHNRWK